MNKTNAQEETAPYAPPKPMIALTLLVSLLVIILNSIKLWFLHTKFRRNPNPLKVMMQHLATADLMQGTLYFVGGTLAIFADLSSINALLEFLYTSLTTYLFTVSLIILLALNILKTKAISTNRWHTKSFHVRLCTGIWLICLFITGGEYVLYIAQIYPPRQQFMIRKLRSPVLTLIALVVFIKCFVKIAIVKRNMRKRINPERVSSSRSEKGSMVYMILQIVVMVLCAIPSAIFQIVSLIVKIDNHVYIGRRLAMALLLNSLLDPITFLIAYKHVWKRERIQAEEIRIEAKRTEKRIQSDKTEIKQNNNIATVVTNA